MNNSEAIRKHPWRDLSVAQSASVLTSRLAADPRSALPIPALKLASDADRKLNRRFRAVSDAALWLAEHHPEIDLDKPYNK